MKFRSISIPAAIAAILMLVAAVAWAQQEDSVIDDTREIPLSAPVTITFAPPEITGRFVLGIFDHEGYLVRTLVADQEASAFRFGLNGLIIDWDGLLTDGSAAPAGRYFVRGYVVGNVSVEGLDYFFNDWIADGLHDWQIIHSVALGPDGMTIAMIESGDGHVLAAIDDVAKLRWTVNLGDDLPDEPEFQTGSPWTVVRDAAAGFTVFSSSTGEMAGMFPAKSDGPFAISESHLVVADGSRWEEFTLPDGVLSRTGTFESPVRAITFAGNKLVVLLGESGNRVDWSDGEATGTFELELGAKLHSVGASAESDSVWITMNLDEFAFIRQVDLSGNVLRELALPAYHSLPSRVSAQANRLGMFDALTAGTRWNVLQRASVESVSDAETPQVVDWETLIDRRTEPCGTFGLQGTKPVAAGSTKSLPDSISVQLAPNPLDPGQPENMEVQIRIVDGRSWLTAPDGLQLVPVSDGNQWNRVAIVKGEEPNSAVVFQGNGWVVEAFSINGLETIFSFDGGTFLLASPKSPAIEKPQP